jgi:hypothetical protein
VATISAGPIVGFQPYHRDGILNLPAINVVVTSGVGVNVNNAIWDNELWWVAKDTLVRCTRTGLVAKLLAEYSFVTDTLLDEMVLQPSKFHVFTDPMDTSCLLGMSPSRLVMYVNFTSSGVHLTGLSANTLETAVNVKSIGSQLKNAFIATSLGNGMYKLEEKR